MLTAKTESELRRELDRLCREYKVPINPELEIREFSELEKVRFRLGFESIGGYDFEGTIRIWKGFTRAKALEILYHEFKHFLDHVRDKEQMFQAWFRRHPSYFEIYEKSAMEFQKRRTRRRRI